MSPLEFHPHLILRTPLLPYSGHVDLATLDQLYGRALVQEAIFLSSPDLAEELEKYYAGAGLEAGKQQRIENTLYKYLLRASSRCTPYGLFATCSSVQWGPHSQLQLTDANQKRSCRLDMQLLCALAAQLESLSSVRPQLTYRPNNTCYEISNRLRYVDFSYQDLTGKLTAQLSSVESSDALTFIFNLCEQAGADFATLVGELAAAGVDQAEAAAFVDQLIDNKLLISSLAPVLANEQYYGDYLTAQVQRLAEAAADESVREFARRLTRLQQLVRALGQVPVADAAAYQAIFQCLDSLGVAYNRNAVVQIDLGNTAPHNTLDTRYQTSVAQAVHALRLLTPKASLPHLDNFKRSFVKRYESQERPLLEVLDEEIGLGYTTTDKGGLNPLVEGLQFAQPAPPTNVVAWDRIQSLLFRKLAAAAIAKESVIELTDADLRELEPAQTTLHTSFYLFFSVPDATNDQIVVESCGGSSAVNTYTRFSHLDDSIRATAYAITAREQAAHPTKILAEIIHLPDSRSGNLSLRPHLRDYEIPLLTPSTLDADYQIHLQDLLVSVREGKVVLRSKRLNREVLPKLSTSQNYHLATSLPLYKFLCDVQNEQAQSGTGVSWGRYAAEYRHIPRVVYKNAILRVAQWNFSKADVAPLLTPGDELSQQQALSRFRAQWRLPRYVTLSEADNELVIDLQNPLAVRCLGSLIKNSDHFKLKEFLFDPARSLVRSAQGQPFCNQFIASLHNEASLPAPAAPKLFEPETAAKRSFLVGEEWVYMKFYSGLQTADRFLTETILPLKNFLRQEGLITKWFFIRYDDPEEHIRVRFRLIRQENYAAVAEAITGFVARSQYKNLLWKVQMDTYTREIERYGPSIDIAESLFHHDSDATIEFLDLLAGDQGEVYRWQWALKSVDSLLSLFFSGLEAKAAFAADAQGRYYREFNVDKSHKQAFTKKFRDHKLPLLDLLANDGAEHLPELAAAIGLLHRRDAQCAPLARQIQATAGAVPGATEYVDLVGSYVHMLVNRIFKADQRLHELVLYDLLCQSYAVLLAQHKHRARQAAPSLPAYA